jgi:hypothetical protein
MALIGDVAARGAPVSTDAREPQRSQRAGIRARSRSRKRIVTSFHALKYASAAFASIFRYPSGECIDLAGDVFIVAVANDSSDSSTIYEYAHGDTTPIATLTDPQLANGCAVDPDTGNLAVSGNGVAIYKNASGNPQMYNSSEFGFFYCGYDDHGNLYLSAENRVSSDLVELVRLAHGSSAFQAISLNVTLYFSTGPQMFPSVQWDGKDMAVTSAPYHDRGDPLPVYRLRISGHAATVIGTTKLSSEKNIYQGQTWIQGRNIVGMDAAPGHWDASLWPYPGGGEARRAIEKVGNERYPFVGGLAVSLAR